MPDPQIRKWTIARCPECGEIQNDVPVAGPGCGAPEEGWETVRVVEAAPVVAALHQIEAAIHIGKGLSLHEVQELRRAVSDA